MLGANISDVGWPRCGEIDIMELVGDEPNKVHGTLHWNGTNGHAFRGGSKTLSSGDFSDAFHVFSVIWKKTRFPGMWTMRCFTAYRALILEALCIRSTHRNFLFLMSLWAAIGRVIPTEPPFSRKGCLLIISEFSNDHIPYQHDTKTIQIRLPDSCFVAANDLLQQKYAGHAPAAWTYPYTKRH